MTDIDLKWNQIGKLVAGRLIKKKGAADLKAKFDALDQSPKNTDIEIQNYCMSHGLTKEMNKEIRRDSKIASDKFKDYLEYFNDFEMIKAIDTLETNAFYRFASDFSVSCTQALVKSMYA